MSVLEGARLEQAIELLRLNGYVPHKQGYIRRFDTEEQLVYVDLLPTKFCFRLYSYHDKNPLVFAPYYVHQRKFLNELKYWVKQMDFLVSLNDKCNKTPGETHPTKLLILSKDTLDQVCWACAKWPRECKGKIIQTLPRDMIAFICKNLPQRELTY